MTNTNIEIQARMLHSSLTLLGDRTAMQELVFISLSCMLNDLQDERDLAEARDAIADMTFAAVEETKLQAEPEPTADEPVAQQTNAVPILS